MAHHKVTRVRSNDYVGPAIWGFDVDSDVRVGDTAHEDDSVTGRRWQFIAGAASDGRLAFYWADTDCYWHPGATVCPERFCGFIRKKREPLS